MLIFRHSIVDTSPFLPDMGEKTAFFFYIKQVGVGPYLFRKTQLRLVVIITILLCMKSILLSVDKKSTLNLLS